ncbi:transposase [Methylomarinum sp. Ch1-1]|uniref:Transposase n=1 Tax=Methylomarinum roseum TaxID=3067653 RepID=A0AAU7NQA3_9GAMM|nr:transposase [Methylomarinum sp. Ch1-1]MDP4520899.1 transposase [Methylomarinum sp. Ch1-1]
MPRIARGEKAGGIYHIINRGNRQMRVYDDEEDYDYFLELLKTAKQKEAIEIHAYCLMPNHFHCMLVPHREKSLSRFMQWVLTSHVRYYHKKNNTSGHVWQGRYKSFIVERESYYITLMRYIEANAKRANLVKNAEDWPYSSLYERLHKNRDLLNTSLIKPNDAWTGYVNKPIYAKELVKIRNSVNRQAPLGVEHWQQKTAAEFGLLSTLNKRGRPNRK